MRYFRYDGEWRYTGGSGSRIQVTIIDLQSGEKYMPAITNKNKSYGRFINHSKWVGTTQDGFHFTCVFREGLWVQGLHKVQIYLNENEFKEKFAEHIL